MVDGRMIAKDDGTQSWQPMGDTEMKSIEELVQSATGFNASRGDVVTVRSLQFMSPDIGTAPPTGIIVFLRDNLDVLIQSFALALAVLGLVFGIIRPILKGGIDNHYQTELDMMRSDYESRIKTLELPPVVEEESISNTQVAIAQAEDAVHRHLDEALTIIRMWLHEAADKKIADGEGDNDSLLALSAPNKKEMAA
jgi:flagellar biosynthesis/type III secretory pathway M-ring protein FliF/YscJ